MESSWILLPDNKLILMQFNKIIDSATNKPKFMNIPSDILGLNVYPGGTLRHVCIVFDTNGAVLQNTPYANIFIYNAL
ncbi:hypothetical protein [Mucilaginibacter sp.]